MIGGRRMKTTGLAIEEILLGMERGDFKAGDKFESKNGVRKLEIILDYEKGLRLIEVVT